MKSRGDFPAQAVVNEQLFHDYLEPSGSLVERLDDANKSICAVEFGTKPLRPQRTLAKLETIV